jgi:hypothetical protein
MALRHFLKEIVLTVTPLPYINLQFAIFNFQSYKLISLNALILSSIGGWVENKFAIFEPRKGLTMNKWAVAFEATFIEYGYEAIFSKALANPSGYLVIKTPVASAKNSLFLEIAKWINWAAIGAKTEAKIAKINKISEPLSLFLE